MICTERLRVMAYFDDELGAAERTAVEHHLTGCAACRAYLDELAATHATLAASAPDWRVPAVLRAGIQAHLDGRPAVRGVQGRVSAPAFGVGVLSGVALAAMAWLAMVVVVPIVAGQAMQAAVLRAHLQSLSTGNLVQVISTDRHTVKPWFAGRTDVSPPVQDFAAQGFRLLGGRVDHLEGRAVAVTVYQHGAHVVGVYAWASRHSAGPAQRAIAGYHLACWEAADLAACAVSDIGAPELSSLAGLLQALAARDAGARPAG